MKLKTKDYLTGAELSESELFQVLDQAKELKEKRSQGLGRTALSEISGPSL